MGATSSTLLNKRVKLAEELLAAHAPHMLIPFMFKYVPAAVYTVPCHSGLVGRVTYIVC